MNTISEFSVVVKQARLRAAYLQAEFNARHEAWLTAQERLILALTSAKEDQEKAEESLRQAALALYQSTGEQHPGPGVEVKVGTKLVYDPSVALAWGWDHRLALTLDKKAFEKIAKASPLDFVGIEANPYVAIASDLGAVLSQIEGKGG